MRPHTRAEAEAVVDTVDGWQEHVPLGARPAAGVRRRRVLPARRRAVPGRRRVRGLPDARGRRRHGPHVRAGVPRATSAVPTGVQSGFFAWVDGAPAEGYRAPRNPAAATGLRVAGGCGTGRDGSRPGRGAPVPASADRGAVRSVRRAGAATAGRRTRARRRARGRGRQRVLRWQHGRDRADGRRRTSPGCSRTSRRAIATCCPTSASPRAGSSTARHRPTCPDRSRSSPRTASRSGGPRGGGMSSRSELHVTVRCPPRPRSRVGRRDRGGRLTGAPSSAVAWSPVHGSMVHQ